MQITNQFDPNLVPPNVAGEPLPAHPAPRDPAWTGLDLAIVVGMAFLAILFGGVLVWAIARGMPMFRSMKTIELAKDARVIVVGQTVGYAITVLIMVLLVRWRSGRGFSEAIRWNWPDGALVPGYLVLGVGLAVAVQITSQLLPIPKQLPVEQFFRDATSAWFMALFGVFIAPPVEELFFRGMFYPVLERRMGIVGGVVVTALAFAFIHQAQLAHAWAPLLLLFMVGAVLTVVRAKTASVAASVLIHMAYNATLFSALWVASDHFQHLDKAT